MIFEGKKTVNNLRGKTDYKCFVIFSYLKKEKLENVICNQTVYYSMASLGVVPI
jgi:hypothetical protein